MVLLPLQGSFMKKHFDKDNNNLKELFDRWNQPTSVLMKRYNKDSVTNFYTWAAGKRCPPLQLLVDMVFETESNIEYALGLTDIAKGNDTDIIKLRLEPLLKESGFSKHSFAKSIETSSLTIDKYLSKDIKMRVETLLSMAEGLNVSIDYLLGLTKYKTWDEYHKLIEPFSGLNPGDAAYISFPDSLEGGNVLLHANGTHIVFPSGKSRSIHDDLFKGVKVKKLNYEG